MGIIISIWTFFQNNILTKPAFFVGLIVFLGYLLLRKPFYNALAGFIKATVGYMILNVAAGGLVGNFRPILAGLNQRFQLNAAVIDPYFGQAAAQAAVENVGRSFTMMVQVLLLAFIWNLVLVIARRLTKVRTVFITGHIMVQQSSTALWIVLFCFPALQDFNVVIMLGLLLGTYWAVSSNMTVGATQELTDGGGFAIGHQQMFGVWLVDKVAEKIGGKNKQKLEDIKLPGFLSIFNENIVATAVLMTFFFGGIIAILGQDIMHELDKGFSTKQSFGFYIVEKAFTFAVYLQILQLGVRLFVGELTESFQGISEKLLPGSMPAIDCAASYGFGHPNAVTIGFLFGALGQFIAIAGLIIFKSPIFIITGFVPVFFDNATFAVFANRKGGVKAACILPLISGVVQVLGGALAAFYFGLGKFGGWHGNFDWDTVWPVFGFIMHSMQYVGVAICIIFLLAIPQLQYYFGKYKREKYFVVAENFASLSEEEN
ncbi:PTS ascorbate transporter subunit IIC [Treponema phagedenis]|uniref:Ascorbate-specific PTS system EIIC component n=1 Tax=Treponema phagedenis TaxID=162 RepID=A0A0B7GPY1_TREPH|nr:PTS ascorbate transporter subunit IIC [Treponema phagedenis]EFW37523.1 putative sugar-specific permease, SgaT/UlaA [Treponema phagedenis F0421]NVP23362.1 PTS ascorbate transporter subunit IIC [Treponema phagedenis]QEJ95584.1 PTS ascorbate transporter subunit IIC [Treponema phagedenis]QEJ98506.1 PTS ascorbate transporter subunit IIC [Treponema phagedenis]QEK01436.1 PTS ascorbate transporter subunit IIC [Treponema phagedenis]